MTWQQFRMYCSPQSSEAAESALLDAGAAAVTFEDNADQPVYEPAIGETPLWGETRVTGLFPVDIDSDALIAQLQAVLSPMPPFKLELLEDKDWERAWMDKYQPMAFGERLWICPSWREPPKADAVNLLLDPGLAFGTGTHPTTAMCLRWLDGHRLDGKTVIDFGCGSGILAIAALLLGASKATGTDIDPQALIASRDNANRNAIDESRFELVLAGQADSLAAADIVLANILAGPLLELAPVLADLVRSGGAIVLSGIIATQAETISEAYSAWFDMELPESDGEWVRLSGTRRLQ